MSFFDFKEDLDENEPSSTKNINEFQRQETMLIRKKLADLNSKDLQQYFHGFREIYDNLYFKKQEIEIDQILYYENLKEQKSALEVNKNALNEVKSDVESDVLEIKRIKSQTMGEIEKKAPELAIKIDKLCEIQHDLAYLKFARDFLKKRDEVRRCLRIRDYEKMLDNYQFLVSIPDQIKEFIESSKLEYKVRMESLNQFLLAELKNSLLECYRKMHFPFEDAIDYLAYTPKIETSISILKCIHIVQIQSSDATNEIAVPQIVLDQFGKRFNFHFYGEKPTNCPSKPEWFFSQLSVWITNNLEYFEVFVQSYLDETYQSPTKNLQNTPMAGKAFINYLLKLACDKISIIISDENFIHDRRLLSHLIDETVLFEKEILELYGSTEEILDDPESGHVLSILCDNKEVLESWIKLERDTISIGIDSILGDPECYVNRYKSASDVDVYLVPNFADSFVILMQSMFERYRAIPNIQLQCRFVKLQLVIVDDFRSRIVQIAHQIESPWKTPFPQLMNALWYLTEILNDWNDIPEFVRLQYYLQTSSNSLAKGIFDESSAFYRHVWRQRAKLLSDSFAKHIQKKLTEYSNEKWGSNDVLKPVDVSSTFAPFLMEINRLLKWTNKFISPDSILTIYHLMNHKVWDVLDSVLISQTSFNYRGASQMLFDITSTLIPLLNSLFQKPNSLDTFSDIVILDNKCIHVLNTLRLLSLPTPTAILLKEEMSHIPEQTLDEKLAPFNVSGLTRARVLEVFEQRCDMNMFI